ncbi:MAG: right-handed parallel beta-helix repeat-containing protein, partial [Planctomycetota bacterium]
SPKLMNCHAVGNTGGDGIVLGDGGSAENCTSRGNSGNGIMCPYVASWNGAIAEGNTLDGFVVGIGSTLTDCQALNNGGNGLRVVDNNSPPRTSTTLLRGCVARGNSNMGFKLNLALVAPPSAGAIDGPASAPAARQSVAQGNGSDGFSVGSGSALEGRMAGNNRGNGTAIAIPFDWGLSLFCIAEGNGSDGFSMGAGSVMEGCIARNNGGNGVTANNMIHCRQIHSEGNTGDGIVVAPGSTLTDCQALNNGGNGIHVTDNNVPAKTATTLLRGCVARSNSNMGFKIVIPPGAVQVATRDQGIATAAAPVAPTPLDVEKATTGAAGRPARGASLAIPLPAVRYAGTGFGCVAEDNLGDGFYLDGEWSLSQCVSRNNGGVGINSWSFGEAQTSSAEGNASDGFALRGGSRLTECTSRGNGGIGVNGEMTGSGWMHWYSVISEGNGLDGFLVGRGGTLTDCQARNNGGVGIMRTAGGDALEYLRCISDGNALDGIVVGSGSVLRNCTVRGNGTTGVGSGIRVTGAGNRLEGNHLLSNVDWGLSLFGGGNLVIGNSASGNTGGNYNIPSGNAAGPIVTATDMATNTSPNVNYDY